MAVSRFGDWVGDWVVDGAGVQDQKSRRQHRVNGRVGLTLAALDVDDLCRLEVSAEHTEGVETRLVTIQPEPIAFVGNDYALLVSDDRPTVHDLGRNAVWPADRPQIFVIADDDASHLNVNGCEHSNQVCLE